MIGDEPAQSFIPPLVWARGALREHLLTAAKDVKKAPRYGYDGDFRVTFTLTGVLWEISHTPIYNRVGDISGYELVMSQNRQEGYDKYHMDQAKAVIRRAGYVEIETKKGSNTITAVLELKEPFTPIRYS